MQIKKMFVFIVLSFGINVWSSEKELKKNQYLIVNAVETNKIDKIKNLLKQNIDLNFTIFGNYGEPTPLINNPIGWKKNHILKLLLQAGANPDGISDLNEPSQNPLCWAVTCDNYEGAEILIRCGVGVNYPYCIDKSIQHNMVSMGKLIFSSSFDFPSNDLSSCSFYQDEKNSNVLNAWKKEILVPVKAFLMVRNRGGNQLNRLPLLPMIEVIKHTIKQ